jgi:crotonobetainyl-CoA:carnitine CoA-transferase CaiB-like acyl-CoA transferase
VADLLGGIFAFSAIQAALVQRARTGEGQVIDVALMDCMINLLIYEMQEAQFNVPAPRPVYGPVAARDGDVLIAPITVRNFEALAEVTQLPALRQDPRFATLASRSAHWSAMMAEVEPWARTRTVAEVVQALEAVGVPCARYNEPAANLQDAALRERGLMAQVRDAAGAFTGISPPWRMSGTASHIGAQVPALGEHTEAVLQDWLGLGGEALARLRQTGAFGPVAN